MSFEQPSGIRTEQGNHHVASLLACFSLSCSSSSDLLVCFFSAALLLSPLVRELHTFGEKTDAGILAGIPWLVSAQILKQRT